MVGYILSVLICLFGIGIDYQPDSISVYLVGDSTMSEKEVENYPETGWGTPFALYFVDEVNVENNARNGRSTRTFLEEGRWDPIHENLKEGDYVLIQFGHNDEVQTKEQSTTPENFKANLTKYISDTRAKEAHPVLLTPIARRSFDDSGNLVDTHKEYSELMRQVAASENVPLIDMDRKSQALLHEMGEEKSSLLYLHLKKGQNLNYPEGVTDNTHFSETGARMMAELVIDGLMEQGIEISRKLVRSD